MKNDIGFINQSTPHMYTVHDTARGVELCGIERTEIGMCLGLVRDLVGVGSVQDESGSP